LASLLAVSPFARTSRHAAGDRPFPCCCLSFLFFFCFPVLFCCLDLAERLLLRFPPPSFLLFFSFPRPPPTVPNRFVRLSAGRSRYRLSRTSIFLISSRACALFLAQGFWGVFTDFFVTRPFLVSARALLSIPTVGEHFVP